jgi:competence/damage-inducible protein CinA-like protein
MPSAEIISIGTELLLGEILDTNARFIARTLRDQGIDLYRKTTVGDNIQRIARIIQEARQRCDIIITTGGLGPTVDDPTRAAVAQAIGVDLEYRPELWDQICQRFQRFGRTPTENNKRQAYIPASARPVENPVGTAPAFIVEQGYQAIIALPGVPREMEHLLVNAVVPYLRQRYQLKGIIKARVIHTSGMGESQLDALIGDLEEYTNPTVGLAAHSGQVDVRITAKADSECEANVLIAPLEKEIRSRLGEAVYGADEETLEIAALRALKARNWSLVIVESGLGGELTRRLAVLSDPEFRGSEVSGERLNPQSLAAQTAIFRRERGAEVGFGVAIQPAGDRQDVYLVLITPHQAETFTRPYGGPPEYAPRWAAHHSLDILRKLS